MPVRIECYLCALYFVLKLCEGLCFGCSSDVVERSNFEARLKPRENISFCLRFFVSGHLLILNLIRKMVRSSYENDCFSHLGVSGISRRNDVATSHQASS